MFDIEKIGLNEAQKEAVLTTEGYIRVVAGPGSGKTKTLVNRYIHLVKNCGVSTNNILCITFTNKASGVMKNRIKDVLGQNFGGYIHTYHGFCARVLRDEIHYLNFPATFNIMDESDTEILYKEIYEKIGLTKNDLTYKKFSEEIFLFKLDNQESYVEYLTAKSGDKELEGKAKHFDAIKEYLDKQREFYYLDFNDLLFFVLYIFDKFPEIKEKYQQQFQYIMVDEYQDTTQNENGLIYILSQKHQNLFVVGDPDQMIYSWRGACGCITSFDKIFTNCKTIYLEINYRSSPQIIELSNSLIKHNEARLDKNMKATKSKDKLPVYYHAKTKQHEGMWIASTIKKLVEEGTKYSDIAIIYRANRNSKFLEEAFMRERIPYKMVGGIGFYQRKEIKDVLSYLRFLSSQDDISFERIINEPSRLFGKKKLAVLKSFKEENGGSLFENLISNKDAKAFKGSDIQSFIDTIQQAQEFAKNNKVSDILSFLYKQTGYEEMLMTEGDDDRLDNVNELLNSIKNIEDEAGEPVTLSEYLHNIALFSDEEEEDKADKIKMMTVHIAKGQEFPYVFVCSLTEGNFPSVRATDKEKMEEERRLAYVAFTRAEKGLFLSDSEGYDFAVGEMTPSRFLFNIEKEQMEWEGVAISAPPLVACNSFANGNEQDIKKFEIGEKIVHSYFGVGDIIGINESDKTYLIQFELLPTSRNVSFDCRDLQKKIYSEICEVFQKNEEKVIIEEVEGESPTHAITKDESVLEDGAATEVSKETESCSQNEKDKNEGKINLATIIFMIAIVIGLVALAFLFK